MIYRIRVTAPAKEDLDTNVSWWSEHRSGKQALDWLAQIETAILSLRQRPHRCRLASDGWLSEEGVYQLLFGRGSRPTHRVLFAIEDDEVIVLRVLSVRQALPENEHAASWG